MNRPGDRRIFYQLSTEGWELVLQQRFRAFTEIREVADKAIAASGPDANDRLHEMRDTWAFMESSGTQLLAASRARRNGPPAPQQQAASSSTMTQPQTEA